MSRRHGHRHTSNGLFVGRGKTGGMFVGRGGQQPIGSRGLFVGRSGLANSSRRVGSLLIPAIVIGGGLAIGLSLAKKL
jgi:hypothetical protein